MMRSVDGLSDLNIIHFSYLQGKFWGSEFGVLGYRQHRDISLTGAFVNVHIATSLVPSVPRQNRREK